ncbi:molybdate ABC transporter substrate-binding protein [Acididesulfobacillus acetoxydans]|nr:molybdate ABC transporter substrate-binding protein [Acididesulfobacillus acetoxydans]
MRKRLGWALLNSLAVLLSVVLLLAGCSAGGGTNSGKGGSQPGSRALIISAAASLQNSLTEIQKVYVKTHPDVRLTFNFGASGPLEQQIEQGAPADLFISAGKAQMDALVKKNLVVKQTKVNLLSNVLVLITGKDNKNVTSVQDLTKPGVRKIGIGTPQSVPAGKYAEESLKSLKLWNTLQQEQKLVLAKDVTQVLTYVEMGSVDAGFVYQSDAQSSSQVKVAAVVPDSAHRPIVYPAAVVAGSKDKRDAEDFLKFLESPQGQQIFAKYGFKTMK